MAKKLKRIPNDLVSYIQIETEAIKTSNDKAMISGYCLSKLKEVEWRIELLECGSQNYVVQDGNGYLESVRSQLQACHSKIMATPIPKANNSISGLDYPKGYEG